MPARSAYTLTGQLSYSTSPLRQYLDQTYPNRRAVARSYRPRPAGTYIDGDPRIAAIVGSAFDLCVRATLDPTSVIPVRWSGGGPVAAAVQVQLAMKLFEGSALLRSGAWSNDVGRAAWAAGRFLELHRAPEALAYSELAPLLSAGITSTKPYLALARPDGLDQLEQLWTLATTSLLPLMSAPVVTDLSLETSKLCAAEIDLLSDGLLIDLKVRAAK